MGWLLEGPVPPAWKKALKGFPVGVSVRAWDAERAFTATGKHRGFRIPTDWMYLGGSEGDDRPLCFLWERPLSEYQLGNYRGVFWYFWVVIELTRAASPYIEDGRLRYDKGGAGQERRKGKRQDHGGPRRAIVGVPCTLKSGPDFSGNLNAAEFRDWITGDSSAGEARRWVGPRRKRRRARVEVDTPNTREGEAKWQSLARRWARETYRYLARTKVEVVALVAYSGDLSPQRGAGINPPRRKR